MKERIEFRISNKYAHLLLNPNKIKKNNSNTVIYLTKDNPEFERIKVLTQEIREKYNDFFFLYSNVKRVYSKRELEIAVLLRVKIKTTFEPAGEECGTVYDETLACEICGANRRQIGPLKLKKSTIPKNDIARTIAGEVVVSKKFVTAFEQRGLKGVSFDPITFTKGVSNIYQLNVFSPALELTPNTIAGVNIFDLSESSNGVEFTIPGGYQIKVEKEIYKCPRGHTIGLNLLSEPYVFNSSSINEYDFFVSNQKVGVKRGLLRPEPIYFCSTAFKKMVEEEKLSGFGYEIARVG